MSVAFINPQIITWARKRADKSVHELSKEYGKFESWENGILKPTFRQAQNLAKTLRIPFGYLYLRQPPTEQPLVPDLRTINDAEKGEFSVDLKDVISNVIRKQDWYRDYLKDKGVEPLSFIGKFSMTDPIEKVAKDITETLNLRLSERKSNSSDFLRYLSEQAESVGIWVIRTGIVGSNTHRGLDVDEFRGFAISDVIAPLIFINSKDFIHAQIFTLAHELAHLWIGESGISNISIGSIEGYSSVEKRCNSIAAEVLVPQADLVNIWENIDFETNIENAHKFFRVSTIVIARRALELRLISKDAFLRYYKQLLVIWKREKSANDKSGGSRYNTLPVANGKAFTEAVLTAVYSGELLMRDGARLLNSSPATIDKLAKGYV